MAAAWLKGYLQASFRGVPFFIKGHRHTGGRRLAKHIFPEREDVEYDDLGKKEVVDSIPGYVLADNYFNQRNDLINALNKKGPGTLVHPYLGVREVHCDVFVEGETTEEGRLARYDITFKKKSSEGFTVSPDNITQVFDAKKNLLETIGDWLDNAYSLVSKPVKAIEDLNNTLDAGLDLVDKVKKIANTQAEFKRALSNSKGKLIELRLSARAIAQDFEALIDFGTTRPTGVLFSATEDNSRAQYEELRGLTGFADEPVTTTPEEIAQADDYPAYLVQQMVVYQAIACMAGLTAIIPFTSAEDAIATEEELFGIIDGMLIDPAITDDLYLQLRQLKAVVHSDLEDRVVNLPRLVDFEVRETTNTLFISNEIYGTIDQEEDIIKGNGIEHPGFVNKAKVLRVKIDV